MKNTPAKQRVVVTGDDTAMEREVEAILKEYDDELLRTGIAGEKPTQHHHHV